MKNKKLTTLESLMLIAGAGIGTGILTIPYAVSQIGILGTILALGIAIGVSIIIYFFIADLTLNSKDSNQILGILKEHLFKGKYSKILTNIFFIIIVIVIIENLIVYILCATDIIVELFNLNSVVSKIIFYFLASIVIFFGIKSVGIGEKYSVILIGSVIIILMILSLFNIQNNVSFTFGSPKIITAVYGLFMFAFSAIFSVVQVTNNIDKKENIKKVLIGGLLINAILTLLFSLAVIIASKEITKVATIGLTDTIGQTWVKIICSIFVLLAMFTSYWSSGLAFTDIVKEQLKINKNVAWLISTIPTIIIAIILPLSVLNYIQIGAGALSVVIGLTIIPAYYNMAKNTQSKLLFGKFGTSKVLIGIAGVGTIVMAIASLIPIN